MQRLRTLNYKPLGPKLETISLIIPWLSTTTKQEMLAQGNSQQAVWAFILAASPFYSRPRTQQPGPSITRSL